MASINRLPMMFKALRQLGFYQLSQYALYQFGTRTGHYRRSTPAQIAPSEKQFSIAHHPWLPLPASCEIEEALGVGRDALFAQANLIRQGQFQRYGADPVPLNLTPPQPLRHWTTYRDRLDGMDIKDVWEPARFGWVYTLGRAYWLTQDNGYAQIFWVDFESFIDQNPPNLGPNWSSAQEIALRLLAWLFALEVFAGSPETTPARKNRLINALALHAERLPLTLPYSRSQNNNHLLSEALGLFTAGLALVDHPKSTHWTELGWNEFNHALQQQIELDGAYSQHSTNYHRLMLELALQAYSIGAAHGYSLPDLSLQRLAAATHWLYDRLDLTGGRTPNLGSHDGAHILPLASGEINDHRPTIQAASIAFCGQAFLPAGPWDELALWIGLPPIERPSWPAAQNNRLTGKTSWASLRAVEYQSRPNHADQLQVELWWQGVNLLCDPGTYRYNAPAPWDNRLVSAFYHNAITVDEQEPMTRAGRFLWLDWDQSKTLAEFTSSSCITAERYGYRKLGILHRRSLEWMGEDDWQVVDDLLPTRPTDQPRQIKLQWLLPDYEYILSPDRLTLCLPSGKFSLLVQSRIQPMKSTLVRAGEVLQGSGPADPCAGWVSPTYSKRSPALSWQLEWRVSLPIQIVTRFHLEAQEK